MVFAAFQGIAIQDLFGADLCDTSIVVQQIVACHYSCVFSMNKRKINESTSFFAINELTTDLFVRILHLWM